jgi:hypothetical protein
MAVVRLLRRKWAEKDEKPPEVDPRAGPHGSDNLPGMAAVCGLPTADQELKKNVPTGRLGGGKLTRRKHSFRNLTTRHGAAAAGELKKQRGPYASITYPCGPRRDRRAAARNRGRLANPRPRLRHPGSGRSPRASRAHRRSAERATSSGSPPGCRWRAVPFGGAPAYDSRLI